MATTTNTVTINEIPVDSTDSTKTAWGSLLSSQYYFAIANGTDAAETFDAADIGAATRARMDSYKRGVSVNMGAGDDTVTGSAYGDIINAGSGVNRIDGGANEGTTPNGRRARDVLNVFAADQAAADALSVTAIAADATGEDGAAYAAGYRIKVSAGAETDYLKGIEQVNVFLAGTNAYVKTIRLALDVYEIDPAQPTSNAMHMAWAQGTAFADSFNAATDISAATQTLMATNKRGVWVDTGAGDDTAVGSAYGDDFSMGAGTNYVDGGANEGSPPWGGKAADVLHVTVASKAAADAVTVVPLTAASTGTDAAAFVAGYTHKVVAGAETDYIKGIERISVQIDTGSGGTSWARDIALTVVVHEANLADPASANYYHQAWVNGTDAADTIDLSGDSALLSAELKAAMATRARGVWVDGGSGDDTITGTGYADNFRNGAGNQKIDGGANAGPDGTKGQDVFEITVASTAEMGAIQVSASDDPAYTWMVTYGAGSTEKDYLKNVEAIVVNVAGTSTGKWIPLAVNVHEIKATGSLDNSMHFAWAQGTGQNDNFDAATDVSAATRALMEQKGRGVWVDLGAGDDKAVGSAYGDDFSMGAGTNYVDGGANEGSPPWGGKAADVLHVTVASQTAADAVAVVQLTGSLTGTDAAAAAAGYTHKVVAGAETDYIKGIERISVQIDTGSGGTSWARDIALTVVVHEVNLADPDSANYYHQAWVNGTDAADTIDLSGDSALLSAGLKAAMAARARGVWVDGGSGDDTIVGTGYADNFRNGAGNQKIDGGANAAPNGAKGQDVFEITVANTAEMGAIQISASDDPAYTWMVTYGAGSTQKDYLKNIEAVVVNVTGTSTGKWIPLAVNVHEIEASGELDKSMHFAWVQGTGQNDDFDAATDVSAATRTLMEQKGRGVWVDLGAGDDTAVGSAYGDDFSMGAGTNYVDGGANAGSPPWGGKAADVLHVTVASQSAADAVTVVQLSASSTGTDAAAFAAGYTHKVAAGAETDYIKGIERISVQIDTGSGGTSWARDIALAVAVHEANLADTNIDNYYHLAWVNGTDAADPIDLSGDSALLSAELKAAMAARGRGVWVDGGGGDDAITGTAYADNFRNGAGNQKIDGGANAGPNGGKGRDVFEITVASTAEMGAIQVSASDDPAYTWMVTYGAGSTQKDYLKNIEAIMVNVSGTSGGKWIPLALDVHEIGASADLGQYMHFAWAEGTDAAETFNADTDVSAATRTLMTQYGRGVRVDMGAGDDTVTGSGFGDNIVAGSGVNYVDGGANAGTMPGGGKAMDVLEIYVADQAAADAVAVTELSATMGGADGAAYAAGYRLKVSNGSSETDYVRDIERIDISIWNDKNGDGQRQYYEPTNQANEVTYVRSIMAPTAPPATPNTAPSFGGAPAGVAVSDAGRDYGAVGGTALSSGKLLALSYLRPDGGEYVLVLNRTNADGTVDTSFGTDGRVVVPTSYNQAAAPVEVAGGKLLVAVSTFGAEADMRVLRLNPDGTLDTTFGSGGSTTVSLGVGSDQARKLVVDASGHITVVGSAIAAAGREMAVLRLNADGSLDTSFNGSGKATYSLGTGSSGAISAALQADGKMVLSGFAATATAGVNQLAAVRVNADGSLDTSFGDGGKVLLPLAAGNNNASAVQVLADGRILLGGSFKTGTTSTDFWDPALVMLNSNGSPDTSFGSGGIVKIHPSGLNDATNGLQVQADGKIVMLGSVHYDATNKNGAVLVTRFNADGSLDTGFGDHGAVEVRVHGVGEQPASLALVGGKIVVFGSSINDASFNTSNIIVRLNGDGTPDAGFGAANPSSLGGVVRGTGAYPVALDPNAALFDAELAARGNYGGGALTLARQGGANADDVFVGVGEVKLANGVLTVAGIAIGSAVQAGGKLELVFNEQATQGLVNRALHGIGYTNASATPPSSVVIDWSFSDNNNGSQGTGGVLGATGSTTVEIGIVTSEVRQSLADPTLTADHYPLSNVSFVANAFGGNGADVFDSATGFSAAARGLMDQLQRGARFDMGAGNDDVIGTAYSDEFTLGAGVNYVDGGGQAGAHPYGGVGRDVLQVIVGSDAEGAAVRITSLDASAAGADKAAFDKGYTVKVVNGAETDYAKNIESVTVLKWTDANGNGVRESNETSWMHEQSLVLRVNEVHVSSTDPTRDTGGNLLSANMHMAWAYGWDFADSFNAGTDLSAATRALMAQYGRGVYVETGAGDDLIVGSDYGDNINAGSGVNRIDGGANGGSSPFGGQPRDTLEVYAADPAAVKVTALNASMTGADGDAYAAGYTWKVFAGAETDYVKNIELVNVMSWNDANGNGMRDSGEVSYHHGVALAALVDEIRLDPADPTRTADGQPLSNYGHYAWMNGSDGADSFSVEANVSAATRAAMAVSGRGVYLSAGGGDDVLSASAWSDHIIAGSGTNKVDGGAGRDTLQMLVADQAAADAVTVTELTSTMTGADAQAYAEGYRYRIANGAAEVNYVKNVENLDISIWQDKNGDGQPDFGNGEVTFGRWMSLVPNQAPTFSGQPGVSITDAGADMTPYGSVVAAGGKIVTLSIVNAVSDGTNYSSVLTRHNPDGSLDTTFGDHGMAWLPVSFGIPARPLALPNGQLLFAMSSSLSSTADFKVVRLNADGSVDGSFGSGGAAVFSLTDGNDVPNRMLLQADGKILVSGGAGGNADFGVLRLNADGSLDTSYNGGAGRLVLPISTAADSATSSALQADGKLLVAGYAAGATNRDFAVVRIGADGTLDASFGDGGKVVLPVGDGIDVAGAVAVQADGKILLGGTARSSADPASDIDLALVRLNANGSLDTSFGNAGKVVLHQSAANDGIGDLLVQADGKIIASGWTGGTGPNPALTVMRFNPDGSPDTMFGQMGVAKAPVHAMGGTSVGLALVDGKIVVTDTAYFNTNYDASLVLMRLNMDGSFDASFNGASTLGGTVRSDGLHPVVLDRNVSLFDAELDARGDYGGTVLTLSRQGGASVEDVFSAAGEVSFEAGRVKVAGADIGWVEQAGGKLTIHFSYAGQGMVERALHGIAYANNAANPAASVVIDWNLRESEDSASLAASGSTTVQIGAVVKEAVRAWVDPAKAADGRVLAEIPYMASVSGTARGETVDANLVSGTGRALMDEFKRGVLFDTGAGDDIITGSAYGDLFVGGSGVNRIDGGANLGTDPAGAAAIDILDVFVADSTAAAAVAPVALTASMSGADLDAYNAGYTYKVMAGAETDYLKNIEAVRVWVWQDKDGDGVRDVSADPALTEVTLVGTHTIPASGV